MKQFRRNTGRMGIVAISAAILWGLWTASLCCQEESGLLRPGDHFPRLIFFNDLKEEERSYLGLGQADSFGIQDIKADLVIVEFLNKYCFHCQVQAPIFVRAYSAIEADPDLRGRVRMIGIGAGNSRHQLEKFRVEVGIQFPLVPDPDFIAYNAIGSPKTPYTLLLRGDGTGNRIVASLHRGVVYSDKDFLEEIRAVLQGDHKAVATADLSGEQTDTTSKRAELNLTSEELARRVTQSMESAGVSPSSVKMIELPLSKTIYMGLAGNEEGQQKLFAKVVSRATFCDVCHDVHFIYVFDERGLVQRLDPIHLTKKANWEWSSQDVQKMRDRVQGRSLSDPFAFNPEVDAVTAATISSQLIFLSLAHGKDIYEELKKEGYLSETK